MLNDNVELREFKSTSLTLGRNALRDDVRRALLTRVVSAPSKCVAELVFILPRIAILELHSETRELPAARTLCLANNFVKCAHGAFLHLVSLSCNSVTISLKPWP